MMSDRPSPHQWAFKLSHVLNTVLGHDHFPINVGDIAKEYSAQICPEAPITLVSGKSLPGFEGGLFKAPPGKKEGWGIFYNSDIRSQGRINFTLAHELGHYLQHRNQYPEGISCGEQDFYRWESEYGQVEHQANQFAANLLMPLDDYRKEISPNVKIDTLMIDHITERYGVSLLAALLRWIEYTEQRAVLVVSRDDFILWARSSKSALKSGAFFRTANVPPVAIPVHSIAANKKNINEDTARAGKCLKEGIWFNEPCNEFTIFSEQYDFVISLIQLPKTPENTYDRIRIQRH